VLSPDETARLVRLAKQGQADAFTTLVCAYLRAAYAVALSVVGRPADAEDVAQEAFLKAFEHIDTCREPERFVGWLLQIARNQARNLLDRRRLSDIAGEGAKVIELVRMPSAAAGQREALLTALATLDERSRELVLLHDLEGWTHPEIAATLDLSEELSRQILFRARRALRAKLGDAVPLEGSHA
jgi:RNA polymerase sigma-70 factor (ECF subfamily)